MKKYLFFFATAITLLLTLVSYGAQPNAQEVLSQLIKPEYSGRLIGTQGNEKAANYLADVFKKIGLSPYADGSFFMQYNQVTADPSEQEPTVTVVYEDGKTQQLKHGKDFVTNAVSKDLNIDLPIELDPAKASPQAVSMVKIENLGSLSYLDNEVLVIAQDKITLVVGTPESDTAFQIRINNTLFDQLVANKAKSIKISAKYAGKNSTLNNVVGIIKGAENSKKALVLTAHFDHVGLQGDYLFNGAIDNASGTAALVATAQKIKALTNDKALDFDIIIAAVNSEESNKVAGSYEGSKVLAQNLSQQYGSLININIDCVGYKKMPSLAMGVTNQAGDGMITDFKKQLTESEIAFSEATYEVSDHSSFIHAGFPAFTIGFDVNSALDILHSANLSAEEIDIGLIEKLSDAIAKYAVSGKGFSAKVPQEEFSVMLDLSDLNVKALAEEELDKVLNGKKLAINEHVFFTMQGALVKANGQEPLYSNEEIHAFFPTVTFPTQLGDYAFDNVSVRLNYNTPFDQDNFPDDYEINKIYTHPLDKNDISSLNASYQNDNKAVLKIYIDSKSVEDFTTDRYLPLDDPGYKNFNLVCPEKDLTKCHGINFTTDSYNVTVLLFNTDGFITPVTKEEIVQNIIPLFSE